MSRQPLAVQWCCEQRFPNGKDRSRFRRIIKALRNEGSGKRLRRGQASWIADGLPNAGPVTTSLDLWCARKPRSVARGQGLLMRAAASSR